MTLSSLPAHLARLRDEFGLSLLTPEDVDGWWRRRTKVQCVQYGNGVRLEGEGSERTRIAIVREKVGKLE